MGNEAGLTAADVLANETSFEKYDPEVIDTDKLGDLEPAYGENTNIVNNNYKFENNLHYMTISEDVIFHKSEDDSLTLGHYYGLKDENLVMMKAPALMSNDDTLKLTYWFYIMNKIKP